MISSAIGGYLAGRSLVAWQRERVRTAKDKTAEYRNQFEPHRIGLAKKANQEFYLYFQRNGIFIRRRSREN
jgi:hypothetical protein